MEENERPERTDEQRKKDHMRARKRMMDLVAYRDHSELEIREKLDGHYQPEDIEAAVEYGKAHGWIAATDESKQALAEKLAESLHRKLKGIHFINHALKEKGLPSLDADHDRELEKARELVETKFSEEELRDRNTQAKAGRFLAQRGFDMDIVRDLIFKR